MSFADDALAVAFFLFTLGLPLVIVLGGVACASTGRWRELGTIAAGAAALAFYPVKRFTVAGRTGRVTIALIRYFSFEILVDRSVDDFTAALGTPAVDSADFQGKHLPALYLACPHGVFNYGAIVWCCVSRWFCGWWQYTGAAAALASMPGIRKMDELIWVLSASRKNIKRVLSTPMPAGAEVATEERRGGMLGMVPDGLMGAFRCKPGVDELVIGKKRGLMRIAVEEVPCAVPRARPLGHSSTLLIHRPCAGFSKQSLAL